jgi:hypothetical protein
MNNYSFALLKSYLASFLRAISPTQVDLLAKIRRILVTLPYRSKGISKNAKLDAKFNSPYDIPVSQKCFAEYQSLLGSSLCALPLSALLSDWIHSCPRVLDFDLQTLEVLHSNNLFRQRIFFLIQGDIYKTIIAR